MTGVGSLSYSYDGTNFSGSGTSTIINTKHTYATSGNYVIKIISLNNARISFGGDNNYGSKIIWNNIQDTLSNYKYQSCITKIEMGNNADWIYPASFKNCYNLKEIILSSTIRSISNFSDCYSLKFIIIPINFISFSSSGVFSNCYSLKKVIFPQNYTSTISLNFLNNCYSIKKVSIPKTITLGISMFNSCYNLEEAVVAGNMSDSNVFASCYNLKKVTVLENCTSFGVACFQNCRSLKEIKILSNITNIDNAAFGGCYNLLNIIFPSSVTTIGNTAFSNCLSIAYYDFTSHTSIPTLVNSNAFQNIPSDCKIIVPDDLYEDWIVANNWSTYASYIIKASDWNNS